MGAHYAYSYNSGISFPLSLLAFSAHNKLIDGALPADEYGPSIRTRAGSVSELGQNGIRFFVQPSFGKYHYKFVFLPRPKGCYPFLQSENYMEIEKEKTLCQIYLVKMQRETLQNANQAPLSLTQHKFIVPEEDFREVLGDLEDRMKKWNGELGSWVDGTNLSIEYVREGNIRSMSSNAHSADSPVSQFGSDVQRLALAFGPTGMIPRGYNWHADIAPESPCSGLELNTPDKDGIGMGDDDCAKKLEKIGILD